MRRLVVAALIVASGACYGWEAVPTPLPTTAWFRKDVCLPPGKLEYAKTIATVFVGLGNTTCCMDAISFDRTTLDDPKLVEPIAFYLLSLPTNAKCEGREVVDSQEQATIESILLAEKAAAVAKRKAEEDYLANLEVEQRRQQRAELADAIRAPHWSSVCAAYGEVLKRVRSVGFGSHLPKEEVLGALASDIRRRGLRVDVARVKGEDVRIGDSGCQVYAALGKPEAVNRTITARQVSEQLVYDWKVRYIYLTNGVVTAIQD